MSRDPFLANSFVSSQGPTIIILWRMGLASLTCPMHGRSEVHSNGGDMYEKTKDQRQTPDSVVVLL